MTTDRRGWMALAFAVVGLLALLTGVSAAVVLTATGERLSPWLSGMLAGTAFGWAMGGLLMGFLLRRNRLGRTALALSSFVFLLAFPVMHALLRLNLEMQMRLFAQQFR